MYLKSLEIHGFKSFAQKTVLTFLPGDKNNKSITAIVGPNGSGKSNVADAIRWVMGEQSMKTLRGKKSEDIIFSGSESKGKLSMASVSLTIDNSDKKLPIDYDELVLTRRVYRTGESEYLVNGNEVRLLDLHLLLAKAQFGQGSYSVIGQGMIDRLLLQSPAERKDFFDEAFGIKEFQIKRHQAVLKLVRTKENMVQAEALLNEVSPRLKNLSRQVKKLEERQEVETSLQGSQECYYLTLAKHNKDQLDALQNDLVKIKTEYAKSEKELQTVQIELAGLAKESSLQVIYGGLQNSLQEIGREKHELERQQATLSGRMQVEYSKVGKQNVGWLENKINSSESGGLGLKQQLESSLNKINSLRSSLNEARSLVEKYSINRTELKSKLASLEVGLSQAKNEQQMFHLSGQKAVQAVLENSGNFGRIFGAVAQLAEVDDKYLLAMDVAAGAHLSSVVVPDDYVAQACIEYLRREQLGYATFLPLSKIKPRYVSQDINQFLSQKGVYGLAVKLAKFDERFADIFSYVFGNTLIVEDLRVAREIGVGRVRMVTLDGDILETSGSMKGGYRKKRNGNLSFSKGSAPYLAQQDLVEHSDKMLRTKQELDEVELRFEQSQASSIKSQTELEVEEKKEQLLREQKQNLDRELAGLKQELSLATMSPEEYSGIMNNISVEKKSIDLKIEEVEKKILEMENKISQLHTEEEEKKKRIFSLQDAMQQAQAEINKVSTIRQEKEIAVAKLETKQEDLENEVYQELQTSLESILKRKADLVEVDKLEALQIHIQKLKYKLTLIGGIDEDVVAEFEQTRERHEGLASQLDDLAKALDNLESLVVELDEIMKKKRSKSFKEIQKEFRRYFSLLFDGGVADLAEIYGDEEENNEEGAEVDLNKENEVEARGDEDLGEGSLGEMALKKKKAKKILTGIDITACPPGKKIKHIGALSGGERTMTSIALICAILHTNPPPFVVLDEVEAALDESNTLRFTKILKELSARSQFVLITHNRATMHATDALYGVTMGNEGVSHLLSVKLEQAEMITE